MALPKDQMLKRALTAVKQAKEKLESVKAMKREPLAIIGIGCRLPGAVDSPAAFWQMLLDSVDGVVDIPKDRWDVEAYFDADPSTPGKMSFRQGGFISDVDRFDAAFFGISPREAKAMDPQQRLLLTIAYEAFEDAGMPLESLRGSQTGVFVGCNSNDYFQLQVRDPYCIDTYTVVGGANAIIANRLSYFFDLRGPSMSVDSACSSSLTAVHLACQSLRNSEVDVAVAAGINLILSPYSMIAHIAGLPIASDNRCKTFDARADGYVRGEGCGVIVLKRCSQALADGDRIYALIRGTAVNQDGRTNGLTAPNGLSQVAVIEKALENAGVEPGRIGFVEAHGTGTALGDPIEVEAIKEVYGRHRVAEQLCSLGAVKSNIGHLEAAAGIVGLIKVALALEAQTIPPNLHFNRINPHIDLDETPFRVATEVVPWHTQNNLRMGAVSAFGAGGTNGHIVLEEASKRTMEDLGRQAAGHGLLVISAENTDSLTRLAACYRQQLDRGDSAAPSWWPVLVSAAKHRSHLSHRLTAVGDSAASLSRALQEAVGDVSQLEPVRDGQRRLVFVFPGQGSQWLGMGRQLLTREPSFKEAMIRCDRALGEFVNWSVLHQLEADPTESRLTEIDVIQPTLWAIEVALAALWQERGLKPTAVIGHSMGEVAAATVAGALSLQDAAQIISLRSRLLRKVSGQGMMAVVGLPLAEAEVAIGNHADLVAVAVSNSPDSTVLSGDCAVLEDILSALKVQDIFCKPIKVDVASHSPQMDVLRASLAEALQGIQPQKGQIPIYSTVADRFLDGSEMDVDYWVNNLRMPVRFASAISTLLDDGCDVFIEMSPHPILVEAIHQNIEARQAQAWAFGSLLRDQDEQQVLLKHLGEAFCLGCQVNFEAVLPKLETYFPVPSYPWAARTYWFQENVDTYAPSPVVMQSQKSSPRGTPIEENEKVLSKGMPNADFEQVYDLVAGTVTKTLGYREGSDFDPHAGFVKIGMDSITAAQVRRHLERKLGQKLPVTAIFKNPTIQRLATFLYERLHVAEEQAEVVSKKVEAAHLHLEALEQLPEGEILQLIVSELESVEV